MDLKEMTERYHEKYEPIRKRTKRIKFGLTFGMFIFTCIAIVILFNR